MAYPRLARAGAALAAAALALAAGCTATTASNPPSATASRAPIGSASRAPSPAASASSMPASAAPTSAAPASASPLPATPTSPAASAAAAGTLELAAGKRYHYVYTPASVGYVDFEILAYTGDSVTYSGKTVIAGQPERVETNATATLTNGVFWTSPQPNPVTKFIQAYPEETVTVKAGTYKARRVDAADGKEQVWFAGPLIVKAVNGAVSMELESVL